MRATLAMFAASAFAVFTTMLAPSPLYAQDASATADALFRQARELHEAKRYAEACPKFAESYRLDPATGSLLALASCHEAEGKLASAWAAYNETVTRARRDGQAERAEAARQRATFLESRLARLTVNLAPGADHPGLQIKRDALVMSGAVVGTPLPIDRGEHTIVASAPGRKTFSVRISIEDGASQVLTIPKLSEAASGTPVVVTPQASPDPSPSTRRAEPAPPPSRIVEPVKEDGSSSALRPLGIVAVAGGVIAAGVGTVFGLQALSKNSESNADGHCVQDRCDAIGKQARLDARDAGGLSTALFVVGGLLVGGGVTMFVLGGDRPNSGPSGAGLLVRRVF